MLVAGILLSQALMVCIPAFPENPIEGVPVTFTVTGSNPMSGMVTTRGDGTASFQHTGLQPGEDTVVASSFGAHSNPALVVWESTGEGCVHSQGFWKNHSDAWPVAGLTLGANQYSKSNLLEILRQPVKGNGLVSLSHQLIAAKLNVASGAAVPGDAQQAIDDADRLIGSMLVPPIGSGKAKPKKTSALNDTLDLYNNGDLPGGPPKCPGSGD